VSKKAGWFTPGKMKEILKMSPAEIKSVEEYTKDKPKQRRPWKYGKGKITQHWVDHGEDAEQLDTTMPMHLLCLCTSMQEYIP
jgi:hypothetical protein